MTQRLHHQSEYPYFVTTNVRDRSDLFFVREYAQLLYDVILQACPLKSFIPLSFCIMPDHLHLLVILDIFSTNDLLPIEDKDDSIAGKDVFTTAGKDSSSIAGKRPALYVIIIYLTQSGRPWPRKKVMYQH